MICVTDLHRQTHTHTQVPTHTLTHLVYCSLTVVVLGAFYRQHLLVLLVSRAGIRCVCLCVCISVSEGELPIGQSATARSHRRFSELQKAGGPGPGRAQQTLPL